MNRTVGDLRQPNFLPSEPRALDESNASQKLDYILKSGLAKNETQLPKYKRVCTDPSRAVSDPSLRPYAGEILSTLLHILLTDTQVWNRTKTILARKKKGLRGLREDISDAGLKSLLEKSLKSETPFEVILEVYSRGAESGGQTEGFNRVNSFIAGGAARRMDHDLVNDPEPIKEDTGDTLARVKRFLMEKQK